MQLIGPWFWRAVPQAFLLQGAGTLNLHSGSKKRRALLAFRHVQWKLGGQLWHLKLKIGYVIGPAKKYESSISWTFLATLRNFLSLICNEVPPSPWPHRTKSAWITYSIWPTRNAGFCPMSQSIGVQRSQGSL